MSSINFLLITAIDEKEYAEFKEVILSQQPHGAFISHYHSCAFEVKCLTMQVAFNLGWLLAERRAKVLADNVETFRAKYRKLS